MNMLQEVGEDAITGCIEAKRVKQDVCEQILVNEYQTCKTLELCNFKWEASFDSDTI